MRWWRCCRRRYFSRRRCSLHSCCRCCCGAAVAVVRRSARREAAARRRRRARSRRFVRQRTAAAALRMIRRAAASCCSPRPRQTTAVPRWWRCCCCCCFRGSPDGILLIDREIARGETRARQCQRRERENPRPPRQVLTSLRASSLQMRAPAPPSTRESSQLRDNDKKVKKRIVLAASPSRADVFCYFSTCCGGGGRDVGERTWRFGGGGHEPEALSSTNTPRTVSELSAEASA